jgi:DNA polymerase/3'-5' exonuclease PolX
MKENENGKLGVDPVLVAEEWWKMSRIQRAARELYKKSKNYNNLQDIETIKKIKRDNLTIWSLIKTNAGLLRERDLRQKTEELLESDPELQGKDSEELKRIAEEALIKEFWELSKKPPRELRLLAELLSDE